MTGRWAALGRDLGGEPAIVLGTSTALLIVSHYQGSTGWFSGNLGSRFSQWPSRDALPFVWWFGTAVILYGIVPLLIATATRGGFTRSYGLGAGDARAGLAWAGLLLVLMIPAAYVASKTPAFQGAYPLAGKGAYTLKPANGAELSSLRLFLVYEASYVAYFVAWEFFFRGWMLNALLPRFGKGAILIQMVPFALMHLGKPEPEAFGSIIAGVALGLLALRTRSFWYGAAVHAGVAVFMDVISAKVLFFHA
jgi:membrane protease YdiL (CAAX protease family)